MEEIRAVQIVVGDIFELSYESHGFKNGKFGINIGQRFAIYDDSGKFQKVLDKPNCLVKFLVIEKLYYKNSKFHKVIRKLFKFLKYKYSIKVEVIVVNNFNFNY